MPVGCFSLGNAGDGNEHREGRLRLAWGSAQILQVRGQAGSRRRVHFPVLASFSPWPMLRTGFLNLCSVDIWGCIVLGYGALLSLVRCLAASLVSTHWMTVLTLRPVEIPNSVSSYCKMSPEGKVTPS